MSVVALMVALAGGTAYAAATIGSQNIKRGAVGSPQLRDRDVRNVDLATNAVTSTKVKDGSLLGQDFKPGQIPSGPRGGTGPRGPGAATFDVTIPEGGAFDPVPLGHGTSVDGISVYVVCTASQVPDKVLVEFGSSDSNGLGVVGTRSVDGQLLPVHTGPDFASGGQTNADVQLIVESNSVKKWVRYDITAHHSAATHSCFFGGQVTPPS
jgi:hypothetical protein